MRSSAPALAPIFRSAEQMRILAELYTGTAEELSITQLAAQTGVAIATASREVARLAEHGMVRTRQLGRMRMVSPNWGLPWARELRAILVQTVGVVGLLAGALRAVPDVAEGWVFGSWAARYEGDPGPFPNDIDVLVIGNPDRRRLNRALRTIEKELRTQVNPVVATSAEWERAARDSFLGQVRARPRVRVPIES
ncbi:MAG: helix-turn-helix domain-containing protein [Acidimicrobiales bacterium]